MAVVSLRMLAILLVAGTAAWSSEREKLLSELEAALDYDVRRFNPKKRILQIRRLQISSYSYSFLYPEIDEEARGSYDYDPLMYFEASYEASYSYDEWTILTAAPTPAPVVPEPVPVGAGTGSDGGSGNRGEDEASTTEVLLYALAAVAGLALAVAGYVGFQKYQAANTPRVQVRSIAQIEQTMGPINLLRELHDSELYKSLEPTQQTGFFEDNNPDGSTIRRPELDEQRRLLFAQSGVPPETASENVNGMSSPEEEEPPPALNDDDDDDRIIHVPFTNLTRDPTDGTVKIDFSAVVDQDAVMQDDGDHDRPDDVQGYYPSPPTDLV